MPLDIKLKDVLDPALENKEKMFEEQEEYEEKRIEEKIKRLEGEGQSKVPLPASPFIPQPDQTITASMAPVIDPTSGLTRTQTALLSPSEQIIAQRQNQGIMGLV